MFFQDKLTEDQAAGECVCVCVCVCVCAQEWYICSIDVLWLQVLTFVVKLVMIRECIESSLS